MPHAKPAKHLHAVVGIIHEDGKVLVSQRPHDKLYGGCWEFPGGKIEANERAIDALKRELYEELAIQVMTCKPWFQHSHSYPDKTVLLDVWTIQNYEGEVKSNEGQVIKWVSYPELIKLTLLEGNIPLLDRIKSKIFML